MSQQITTAMVKQYSRNVLHLVQQKGSRLAQLCRRETINAEESFYDRIGAAEARRKTGRHSDVVYSETPHSRRRVVSHDFYYSDLVDKEDKLRIIMYPESEYAIAARNCLARAMDDVIIAAALGNAYSGKNGEIPVPLPDSQKIVAFDSVNSPTGGSKLNVETLRATKKLFNANETGDSDLYFTLSAEQIDSLLSQTEVGSFDYNSVKALVNGEINTFMGFTFIHTERLPATTADVKYDVNTGKVDASGTGTLPAGARICFAWQRQGLILATAREVFARVDPIPHKHYANQVYAAMSIGATRIEDERVVAVHCLD